MSDEILVIGRRFGQECADLLDHLVAAPIAVGVVVGLEVVKVAVGSDKAKFRLDQSIHLFVDGHVARKLRQGIGVAGGANLHVGDDRHQFAQKADAAILSLPGDDNGIADFAAAQAADDLGNVLCAPRLVEQQRRVHDHGA